LIIWITQNKEFKTFLNIYNSNAENDTNIIEKFKTAPYHQSTDAIKIRFNFSSIVASHYKKLKEAISKLEPKKYTCTTQRAPATPVKTPIKKISLSRNQTPDMHNVFVTMSTCLSPSNRHTKPFLVRSAIKNSYEKSEFACFPMESSLRKVHSPDRILPKFVCSYSTVGWK
jgi:hypothetical protein